MTTITASTSLGIVIAGTNAASYSNPIVVSNGITITREISGPADAFAAYAGVWTLVNGGAIPAANKNTGVYLANGGTITNANGATISGQIAVAILGAAGSVDNAGTIAGSTLAGYGITLQAGGAITNEASGTIRGFQDGIYIQGSPGTVINDGAIAATTGNGAGVKLYEGGFISNAASGSITGAFGVLVNHGPASLVNYGTITGGVGGPGPGAGIELQGAVTNEAHGVIEDGVQFYGTVVNYGTILGGTGGLFLGAVAGGGLVMNASSGTIVNTYLGVNFPSESGTVVNQGVITMTGASALGVALRFGGTLVNGGEVNATGGTAVSFGGTANLLALEPGYGFSGVVLSPATGSNTIELVSGGSMGTVTGLGVDFLNFETIAFAAGATWSIAGVQQGLAGPISGFAHGDTIQLTGFTAVGSSFGAGVLTLDELGGGTATLDLPGTFSSTSDFTVTNVARAPT